ncbi:MAG: hypothetical protein AAFO03_08130 [Bacteroidota bacterium]
MKSREIVLKALSGQTWSHVVLVLGTIGAVVPATFYYGLNELHLNNWLSSGLALIVGIAAAKIVDGGLKTFLPAAVAWVLGRKDRPTGAERNPLFNILIVVLSIMMLGATIFLNLTVSPDVVQMATGDADTATEESKVDRREDLFRTALKPYEKQMALAESELKDAQKEKDRLLDAAERSQGTKMYNLYRQGNKWAKIQLQSAINKATSKGSTLLTAAQQKYDQAIADQKAFVSTETAAIDSVQVSSAERIAVIEAAHNDKQARWTSSVVLINIFALIAFIVFTILVVIWEIEEGQDARNAPTLHNVYRRATAKAGSGMVNRFRDWFNLDEFVLSPALAAPTAMENLGSYTEEPTHEENPTQENPTQATHQEDDTVDSSAHKGLRPCSDDGCTKVKVVYHTKENKEVVPYTMAAVNSRIRQYTERLEKARKGNDSKQISNNQRWLDYWTGKLAEFYC